MSRARTILKTLASSSSSSSSFLTISFSFSWLSTFCRVSWFFSISATRTAREELPPAFQEADPA